MENQNTQSIGSHEILEAMEQLRAGFTISRLTFGTLTLVYTLKRKDEKWAKKFTKIQEDYHKFLLKGYEELEEEYKNKLAEEQNEAVEE